MRLQDYVIDATKKAMDEFFRYAKSVPADKIEWKPLDEGRSVLDLARELAKTPDWALDTISAEALPELDEKAWAEQKQEMESWTTIEQCEAECQARLAHFNEAVRQLLDEHLSKTKFLPYEGGRDFTYAEMIEYPRWNANYHLGQIGYIQILYGDREMH
jgi:hypothetical protein